MKRFLTDILIPLLAIVLMVISISSLAAIEFPDYTSETSFSNEGASDEKNIVEVPDSVAKEYADAENFRDPFFLLRGYRGNSEYLLAPGTTIDGIRFNSYADSSIFVENYYRESNFAIEDVLNVISVTPEPETLPRPIRVWSPILQT